MRDLYQLSSNFKKSSECVFVYVYYRLCVIWDLPVHERFISTQFQFQEKVYSECVLVSHVHKLSCPQLCASLSVGVGSLRKFKRTLLQSFRLIYRHALTQ